MIRQFKTKSVEETIQAGRELSSVLAPPLLAVLRGDLGVGKTTLVKGIAEGFHAAQQDDVTSPTFTLVHEYRGPAVNLYHIDLYRVDTERELLTLGLDDLVDPRSILLVEWGDKFERFRKECDLEIALERRGNQERVITITSAPDKR